MICLNIYLYHSNLILLQSQSFTPLPTFVDLRETLISSSVILHNVLTFMLSINAKRSLIVVENRCNYILLIYGFHKACIARIIEHLLSRSRPYFLYVMLKRITYYTVYPTELFWFIATFLLYLKFDEWPLTQFII